MVWISDYGSPQAFDNRCTTIFGVGDMSTGVRKHYGTPTSVVFVAAHVFVADAAAVCVGNDCSWREGSEVVRD